MTVVVDFDQRILQNHIAILGKTGSGKTSTGKLLVEQVVRDHDARVCVLDPIKSDWWGLISDRTGKKPGLDFYILGGPHGHVPLASGTGHALGDLVGAGRLKRSIIDMADFEPGGLQRFFIDFADTLLKKNRGVLYLVVEEAHEFAPKERAGFERENMAIHFAKKLATAGRSKGVRLVVLSQRTQSLHNAVLGSCETMIVHRFTAPADQEPVKKWLAANVQAKARREEIVTSLARLADGEAWFCSGVADAFERVQFGRISTFDNSATPMSDEEFQNRIHAAEVDLEALQKLLGEAASESLANDPAQVGGLRAPADDDATAALREEIATLKAHNEELWRNVRIRNDELNKRADFIGECREAFVPLQNLIARLELSESLVSKARDPDIEALVRPRLDSKSMAFDKQFEATFFPHGRPRKTEGKAEGKSNGHGVTLPAAQFNTLRAIYWLRDEDVTAEKVGFYAGYSTSSSTWDKAIGRLRVTGLVQGLRPTEAGVAAVGKSAGERPTGQDLHARLRHKLPTAMRTILDVLVARRGKRMMSAALAEEAGYSTTSSTWDKAIGRLRVIGAAEGYDKDGGVRAAEVFL